MTQADLNRAVAEATGETISEIKHRGFQPLDLDPDLPDPEDLIIDWDELEQRRNIPVFEQRYPRAVA